MDGAKIDLKKRDNRAEGSLIQAELGEEELAKVSGGKLYSACVKGEHINDGKPTC